MFLFYKLYERNETDFNGYKERDSIGVYLTIEQLTNIDLSERSISSRVGGSRRVCKRSEINDVLLLKTIKGKKRCYLSEYAISTILQLADDESDKKEYLEFLEDEGLNYPE